MGENLHIIDINPDSEAGSSPSGMTLYKNKVYFQGTTTATGAELWAYDLDTDTASLAADIRNVENASSSPTQLTVFNGKLYFSANDGTGHNLWSYDGTSDPVQVSNFTMTYEQPLGELTVIGDRLFFSAHDTGSTQTTAYYYTEADGVVEMQYSGASLHNDGYEFGFTAFGDAVCFGAYDGTNVGDCELFVYIFELGNAVKYDVYPNELPDIYPSHPHDFVALNDVLYFAATDNLFGTDFHRLYGAYGDWLQGAINIGGEIESNPSKLTVVGNFVYFSAQGNDANYELWRFNSLLPVLDGVNPSSIEIYDGSTGSNPSSLLAVGPVLFFAATDASYGTSLWFHNSINGTTQPISNLGETGMFFSSLIRAGINLVFKAGSDGDDLWVYDPLSAARDIDPAWNPYPIKPNPEGVSNPGDVLAVGNRLFFNARGSQSVYELWTYEIY
ncbi:MAG TPA: hypothetical protein P5295_06895 [Spirochaetota bacterium]|nr:hypothetical protein [Spirochaetota bacterium]